MRRRKDLELWALKEALGRRIDVLKLVESDGNDGTETGMALDEMIQLSGMTENDFRWMVLFTFSLSFEVTHFQVLALQARKAWPGKRPRL